MTTRKPERKANTVIIFRKLIRAIARAVTAAFAIILHLVPIIALNAVQETFIRFTAIFLAAAFFIMIAVVASTASIAEIFAARAPYSAVLVLFVSGNGL